MNAGDRVKLLFGPYQAPPLRRGDRAFCLLRDCDVVITSWTDARIPWPRCRAVDGTGGGSGLLLDEELARAVRHESATAIMHWWGASSEAVKRWRRVLGVRRTENEGTRRLMLAASEKGAEVTRGQALSPQEVERRRQTAREKDLAQYLRKGFHGPWWTARELALLGTLPDEEVAAKVGRTPGAVRSQRQLAGIPNPESNRWSKEEDDLVKELAPREAATRTGRSLPAVYSRRQDLRVPDGRATNGRRPRRAAGRRELSKAKEG